MLDHIGVLRAKRVAVVNRDGSPIYPEFHGVIGANAVEYREVRATFPDARKYEPLDHIIVTNNSDENFQLSVNGNAIALVSAKSVANIANHAVWNYTLTNLSATATAANEVHVSLSRDARDADSLARGK